MVKCPKCGSEQITANQKGFSGGKAVAGAVLTGGIGLLAGLHGSKKIIITCLSCGNEFKPGDKPEIKLNNGEKFSGTVSGNNAVVCGKCNDVNPLFYHKCKSCNHTLSSSDIRIFDKSIELKPKQKESNSVMIIFICILIIILIMLVYFN